MLLALALTANSVFANCQKPTTQTTLHIVAGSVKLLKAYSADTLPPSGTAQDSYRHQAPCTPTRRREAW